MCLARRRSRTRQCPSDAARAFPHRLQAQVTWELSAGVEALAVVPHGSRVSVPSANARSPRHGSPSACLTVLCIASDNAIGPPPSCPAGPAVPRQDWPPPEAHGGERYGGHLFSSAATRLLRQRFGPKLEDQASHLSEAGLSSLPHNPRLGCASRSRSRSVRACAHRGQCRRAPATPSRGVRARAAAARSRPHSPAPAR